MTAATACAGEVADAGEWAGWSVELDIHQPHSARLKDYLLGGTTNFAADRELLGHVLGVDPGAARSAEHSRAFLSATTSYLGALGMRQFLDLGCGLPAPLVRYDLPDLHQLAASAAQARVAVVYSDNDPIVLSHAQALLRGSESASIALLRGDLTRPHEILAVIERSRLLDLSAPIAVSLHDVLHLVDDDQASQAADALKTALAPGSTLTISHPTGDLRPQATRWVAAAYQRAGIAYHPRTVHQIAAFFDGWEMLGPGLVPLDRWDSRAATNRGSDGAPRAYGALARKPDPHTAIDARPHTAVVIR